MKRALVSVSNKDGLEELAAALVSAGIEIISTGGTFRFLTDLSFPVIEISEYTSFPEMMDGRVKTLHPKVHGGILARRDLDLGALEENGIVLIDLVVVNLYPFEETISGRDVSDQLAIENIDIGGPAMIRSAAKNHQDVLVVVDPNDYEKVIEGVQKASIDFDLRREFAKKAFQHTAHYDAMIAGYFAKDERFPEKIILVAEKQQDLRYGENPHQRAAFYRSRTGFYDPLDLSGLIAGCKQLHGKELSFNNIADSDAALECVKLFKEPACVIVKHGNPCGVATSDNPVAAYQKAVRTDPTSAFGGVIAFNRKVDAKTISEITNNQFVEVIIAPDVSNDVLETLRAKKNVRLLVSGAAGPDRLHLESKRVAGGLLIQDADDLIWSDEDFKVVTKRRPSDSELRDLEFAWKVCWHTKSNAIVYAKDCCTVGVGAGQMSRVISAKIASMKAAEEGLDPSGAVMASDAFFPFRDGIDAAATAGIDAVIQPGGSVRDQEVIEAADEHGLAMVFTGTRHFRH